MKQLGVSSLAIGTVGGAFCGPFLLNWAFARRAGAHYKPILDWHDKGLHEWVRLSIPLMAGVSLVTADSWIIAHFASKIGGAVSQFNYAKQLFTAPMAVCTGSGRGFDAILRELMGKRKPVRVCAKW